MPSIKIAGFCNARAKIIFFFIILKHDLTLPPPFKVWQQLQYTSSTKVLATSRVPILSSVTVLQN